MKPTAKGSSKAEITAAENALSEKYLFENNPLAMWIIDVKTAKFLDVNKMAILQYGYSRDEFLQMTAIDIRPEEDKELFRLSRSSQQGEAPNFNKGIWKHQKKNGEIILVEIFAQDIAFEGAPARIILSNDVTERKKTETDLELRNKELADYKFALDETSIVGITDNKGKIIYANDNFCKISKYSREELIGRDYRIIKSGHHSKAFIKNLLETIRIGKTWKGEIKNRAKDGSTYWEDTTIVPFLDEQGEPFQYVSTRFDITKRKEAELKLRHRNKELVRINNELDRFVYSVSHDLRSPLTSIRGLLSFIEEESSEADTIEYAKMIRSCINRQDAFIENILTYSRNNRLKVVSEKIIIQQTAAEIINSLQGTKEAEGITFDIDITEDEPFYSDRLRFYSIMEHLISNAVKHHKQRVSGRYIKISGKSDPDKLKLSVADNGIGIDKEYHKKIFEMFFRLSGQADGSGIGLYIVKDTIDKLQGSIEVQSEKGIGSIFNITLKNLNKVKRIKT
ncbi:PAS domain S-box protein [Flavobacterium sp. GT3R68]|uniref:sensor histidine kinase n=1 Tax=Flavobacterium sp. GT3R68 TaxID=2594437 RepID=UPI000F879BB9|nr:PAS domain-containing sensor histidine kinase [Flavobacterium sp. GT3R68]RTY89835.1 PAS domain-containing sensor histidine kinase [Flavobacterium sp. GSN2]TRW89814.1 PAS domain-containing sensor histidine kinase [Flavobacterium sp. GT3R68]